MFRFAAFLRFLLLAAILVAATAAILTVLAVSREPAVAARATPSAAELDAGQRALREIEAVREAGRGAIHIDPTAMAGLAAITSRATGVERLRFDLHDDQVSAAMSHDLGAGLWANLTLSAVAAAPGDSPKLRMSVGRVTIPSWAMPAALKAAHFILKARGTEVPPLDGIVRTLAVGRGGLSANVRLPGEAEVTRALSGLRAARVDTEQVLSLYCRLVEQQRAEPDPSLAAQVRRAFAVDRPSDAAANRAAFVALAMLAVDVRVGALAGLPRARTAECRPPRRPVTLAGRSDLAKHWALSAALVAVFGSPTAQAAGEFKELADSGADGSGFSFVDLAADRGGLRAAGAALDAGSAASASRILASAEEDLLLPSGLRSLPEGLSEAQFAARYGSIQDPRFRSVVRTIDAELDRRWRRALDDAH